jgi:hypothetical protein
MALAPLKQWFCDRCRQLIEEPAHGAVVWQTDGPTGPSHTFEILHKPKKSLSYSKHDTGCFPDGSSSDVGLEQMLGSHGLNQLLSLLDRGAALDPDGKYLNGVRDVRGYVELLRRVQVPYYEEARRYFKRAREEQYIEDNGSEMFPEEQLVRIVSKYTGDDLSDAHEQAMRRIRGES